jgi:catalase
LGKKTDLFARFTTVAGERGAADAERDIRGFAVKFYTEEGNWDLVGNNTPVFFLRDPLKFPDLNHASSATRAPTCAAPRQLGLLDALPESLHQVTIVMSDRGLPELPPHARLRLAHLQLHQRGKNERFWVKFHFKSQQGIQNLTDAEAEAIIGKDRESHQRDLFESDREGRLPALDALQCRSCPRPTQRRYPTIPST